MLPRPLYYYPLSFGCPCDVLPSAMALKPLQNQAFSALFPCDISCDTYPENRGFLLLSGFLSLPHQTTKKPPKPWLSQHLRGFKKVELRGIEPLKTTSIYQYFRAACDISCDTYMILNCLKCSLIFLFCRAVSRSITFL